MGNLLHAPHHELENPTAAGRSRDEHRRDFGAPPHAAKSKGIIHGTNGAFEEKEHERWTGDTVGIEVEGHD